MLDTLVALPWLRWECAIVSGFKHCFCLHKAPCRGAVESCGISTGDLGGIIDAGSINLGKNGLGLMWFITVSTIR